jgi:Ser/Thr protein kinase RdoA (MazF antagonist)
VEPSPAILQLWDAVLDPTAQIVQGRNSRHWRVSSGTGDLALRMYGPDSTAADAEAEHALLRDLHGHGVQVPVPVPTVDGRSVVALADGMYSAFTWVHGDRPGRTDTAAAAAAGTALARAHAGTPGAAVTSRWGTLAAYDQTVRWQGRTLVDALELYEQEDAVRARTVRDLHDRLSRALGGHRSPSGRPVMVHYDVHVENLLLTPHGVAILDWAFAHPDDYTTDLAIALRMWPEGFPAFLAGYESKSPVDPADRALLPALAAARGMDHLADRLTRWAAGLWPDIAAEVDAEARDLTQRIEQL